MLAIASAYEVEGRTGRKAKKKRAELTRDISSAVKGVSPGVVELEDLSKECVRKLAVARGLATFVDSSAKRRRTRTL